MRPRVKMNACWLGQGSLGNAQLSAVRARHILIYVG